MRRVIRVEELLAGGDVRPVLAVVFGRRSHLNHRSGNPQRAKNSQSCSLHFFLRSSDAKSRHMRLVVCVLHHDGIKFRPNFRSMPCVRYSEVYRHTNPQPSRGH